MKHKAEIRDKGVYIDDILINEEVFKEEKVDYILREREEQIDCLIDWIEETKESDKWLMKEDLKMLMSWKCKYIFSSISTNEYIADDDWTWDNICEDILAEHKKIEEQKA
jgi:hypothetical protein